MKYTPEFQTQRELTATKQRTEDNSLHSQGLYVHLTESSFEKQCCICKEATYLYLQRKVLRLSIEEGSLGV